jgi:CO/xanthine dehydrogenase FAD-binding subunit
MIRARDARHAIALAPEGLPYAAGLTAVPVTRARPAPRLVDITGIDAFCGIAVEGRYLRIGALTTLEGLRRHPLVATHAPELSDVLPSVASLQVRNVATLGGNIAWGQGDLLPILIAADARLSGPELDVSAQDYAGGLIGEVSLPIREANTGFAEKVGWRAAFSPTVVTVAGRLRMAGDRIESWRLAIGGGGPACRLTESERQLVGRIRSTIDWPALTASIAHEAGGDHRGNVAARVIVHHLKAAMT